MQNCVLQFTGRERDSERKEDTENVENVAGHTTVGDRPSCVLTLCTKSTIIVFSSAPPCPAYPFLCCTSRGSAQNRVHISQQRVHRRSLLYSFDHELARCICCQRCHYDDTHVCHTESLINHHALTHRRVEWMGRGHPGRDRA